MKTAPFAYVRPSTVADAVAELAGSDGDGKVLAGGQSLVPVLAMRLARPPVLVDINAVDGLAGLVTNELMLDVGATVRQRQAEHDSRTSAVPLLAMALPWVGHRELRTRGTVCGSLAHADPAAELPAVAVCLGAILEVAGPAGTRTVPAREFFTGAMSTQLGPADILVRASFPVAGPGEGFGFAEYARRHGDFALAGVAVRVRRSPREAVLAAFGVSDRPVFRDVTSLLDEGGLLDASPVDASPVAAGASLAAEQIAQALAAPMAALAEEIVDTGGDVHASAGYRRRLFATLAAQELARAQLRARGEEDTGGHHQQATDTRTEGPTGPASPGRQARRVAGVVGENHGGSRRGARDRPNEPGLVPGEWPVSRRSTTAGREAQRGVPGGRPPGPTQGSPPRANTETSLTVNGDAVVLRLPARVTLADALRDHLGLTGTHLGCEHGICGMCTVLVEGLAARSCLLFACQLSGAEIVTVEGLGRPGAPHPLQQAFGDQHALQCGFCTPAFLLSAYDLLSRRPDVTRDELPEELSGVLCRCTGYRNILTAVGQVADAYRDGGLPGPGNCATAALSSRPPRSAAGTVRAAGSAAAAGAGTAAGASAQVAPGHPTDSADRVPASGDAASGDGASGAGASGHRAPGDGSAGAGDEPRIQLPQGPPTFTTTVTSTLAVPPDDVWRILGDVHLVARCLPGAELTGEVGADRYRGRARVGVGPVRLSFTGLAEVTERDEQRRVLRVLAQGKDAGGGQTQADIQVTAEPSGDGCRLVAEATVYLTGRIAQFGRALAGDVSRRLFEQFAAAVEQAAVSGAAPQASPAPPGALRLLASAVTGRLRTLLRRWRR